MQNIPRHTCIKPRFHEPVAQAKVDISQKTNRCKIKNPDGFTVGVLIALDLHHPQQMNEAAERRAVAFPGLAYPEAAALNKPPPLRVINQWNCSSSVEPVRALTDDVPPWITVVTSAK